jgi:hypothetical protein
VRALAPTAAAVVVVLAMRLAIDTDRTGPLVLGELAVYLAINAALTIALERALLSEAFAYLRRPRAAT